MKAISPCQLTWILGVGFVLSWNSGFIGAEFVLPSTKPLTLLFWRYWGLTLLLFGWLLLRRRLNWPGTEGVILASIVGILAHGVWLGCVLYSLGYGVPAGIVALVVALQPMATGALSGPVVGERTSRGSWAGLVIGLAGVMIAVLSRIQFSDSASVFAFLMPFGSVLAITVASLIMRRLEVDPEKSRLPLDHSLFYQSLGVAVVVTVPAIALECLSTEWSPAFAGGMLWLIIGVSLSAYALMWLLIGRIDATRVASLFYLGPPVTMLMAWAAFGDKLLMTDLAGLLVTFAGVLLAQVKS